MWISSLKKNHKFKWLLPFTFSLLLIFVVLFSFWQVFANYTSGTVFEWSNITENSENTNSLENTQSEEKDYIKWFEFNVSYDVLDKTSKLDINSHTTNDSVELNWIELISYLACKYGNDFSKFKQTDLDTLVEKLQNGQSMEDLTKDMKYYSYYFEGYNSVLHEFIGDYQAEIKTPISSSNTNTTNSKNTQTNNITNSTAEQTTNTENLENTITEQEVYPAKQFEETYGIKAFHPIAKYYSYSHYDDFGATRSYGYKRLHWGNDLMGSIGTPIIAVESGIVEAVRLESIWWLENWYS